MNATPLNRGVDSASLCRILAGKLDPLALYAALSQGGARPDTMLFEQADGPTFLLEAAALRAECRGGEVILTALSGNGHNLLNVVSEALSERVAADQPRGNGRLRLRFPPIKAIDADERLEAPSPLDAIRALTTGLATPNEDEPYGVLGLGIFAYDHVDFFEDLPPASSDPLDFPDYIFWIAESLIVFEPGKPARAQATAFLGRDGASGEQAYYDAARRLSALVERCTAASPVVIAPAKLADPDFSATDLDDEAFGDLVLAMKEHIAAGDVYQIVASRSFAAPCANPLSVFAGLRLIDRSPYNFFVAAGSHVIFGASPETSVRVETGHDPLVEVRPIAGTRRRGQTQDEDNCLEAELRLDAKEQAEHMMLVDLARNDVARVSETGSRRVNRLMQVERYARVMHLVSSVSGRLKQGFDFTHAMKSCLNMGTLTGAPKIRAMQLLRRAEPAKRGPYGGTIGWVSGRGSMDSAILIRSAVVKDGIAHVRAGAGIVHDSDPAAESDETKRKASAILSVLAGAGQ